jgi:hypothetical protein
MTSTAKRLLADIRRSAPDITARAAEIEAGRRIPLDLVETLRSIDVFRLFVPQSHGGFELDMPAALEIIGALGRIDGSPLQRRLRDLHAAAQHAVAHQRNYISAGKPIVDPVALTEESKDARPSPPTETTIAKAYLRAEYPAVKHAAGDVRGPAGHQVTRNCL